MSQFRVEYTDTFGGQPNYSWVRRENIIVEDAGLYANDRANQMMIMKAAKAAVGLTGAKGRTTAYGDRYEFRPYGATTVMFVDWGDDDRVADESEEG